MRKDCILARLGRELYLYLMVTRTATTMMTTRTTPTMMPTIRVIWECGLEGSGVATKGSVVVLVVAGLVRVVVDFVVFLLVVEGVDVLVVCVEDLVDVDEVEVDDVDVDDVDDVDVSNKQAGVKVTSSIAMLPRSVWPTLASQMSLAGVTVLSST